MSRSGPGGGTPGFGVLDSAGLLLLLTVTLSQFLDA